MTDQGSLGPAAAAMGSSAAPMGSSAAPMGSSAAPMEAAAALIGSAKAHAKINLRHRVFARDETGFHGVETLLARTSLTDTVTLFAAGPDAARDGVSLSVEGPHATGVPDGPDNLCWRAAERFLARAFPKRRRPAVHIRLEKRIPMGSGLGGGSADAGTTLRLLADRWPRLDMRVLVELAGEIGSDVPFALIGVPMALGWERGRRLLPLRPPRPRPALLVLPGIHVSTPEAYGWLGRSDADAGSAAILPGATRLADWESLERLVRNDLQAPVLARHPVLSALLERLRSCEPAAAGMTGSGSGLFAIFRDDAELAGTRRQLRDPASAQGAELVEVRLPL